MSECSSGDLPFGTSSSYHPNFDTILATQANTQQRMKRQKWEKKQWCFVELVTLETESKYSLAFWLWTSDIPIHIPRTMAKVTMYVRTAFLFCANRTSMSESVHSFYYFFQSISQHRNLQQGHLYRAFQEHLNKSAFNLNDYWSWKVCLVFLGSHFHAVIPRLSPWPSEIIEHFV